MTQTPEIGPHRALRRRLLALAGLVALLALAGGLA